MEHVKRIGFNLTKGHAMVEFNEGHTADPALLWKAVKHAGFTPVSVNIKGKVYRGRK